MKPRRESPSLTATALAVTALILVLMATSCSRGITPFQAANGGAKCGRWLK